MALGQRLGQHRLLPLRVAAHRAELLVGCVVGAQRVAVAEQDAPAVRLDQRRVVQQPGGAAGFEAGAQQEVAVAAHHVQRGVGGEGAHRGQRRFQVGGVVVVSHPVFEQVSQDVQRRDPAAPGGERVQEQLVERRGVVGEVQVGDEMNGHGCWFIRGKTKPGRGPGWILQADA